MITISRILLNFVSCGGPSYFSTAQLSPNGKRDMYVIRFTFYEKGGPRLSQVGHTCKTISVPNSYAEHTKFPLLHTVQFNLEA